MWTTRPALAAALLLTVTACTPAAADTPQPQSSAAIERYGAFMNCGGPVLKGGLPDYEYDLNDDGAADIFKTMHCAGKGGDQLEVFDGRADPPARLGGTYGRPPVHMEDGVSLAGGCLMFSGATFLVGVKTGAQVTVRVAGRWDRSKQQIVVDRHPAAATMPCPAP